MLLMTIKGIMVNANVEIKFEERSKQRSVYDLIYYIVLKERML